jgi:hypothetical protein
MTALEVVMRTSACAECLQAMARGKSELLARIACANCEQAQADLAQAASSLEHLSSRRILGARCSQCGKWCFTKWSLATHRRGHRVPIR